MKIKVTKENAVKINHALIGVNGRSIQHTYHDAIQIISVADRAEKALTKLGLNLGTRSGAIFVSVSGDSVPNSYKGTRNATRVELVRGSAAWFLTHVSAETLFNDAGKEKLHLTEKQDAEIIAKVRANYTTIRATA